MIVCWRRLMRLAMVLHRVQSHAVGLCSQVNTHVFVDGKGNALLPAMTWQDGRCAEEAKRLDALVSA